MRPGSLTCIPSTDHRPNTLVAPAFTIIAAQVSQAYLNVFGCEELLQLNNHVQKSLNMRREIQRGERFEKNVTSRCKPNGSKT